jgi:hypothetical protein
MLTDLHLSGKGGSPRMTTSWVTGPLLNAFAGELRKVATFPALRRTILFGLIAVIGIAAFGISQSRIQPVSGAETHPTTIDWPMFALHYGQAVPILIGAWIVGQDISPGPLRTAFLAQPRRVHLALAKYSISVLLILPTTALCILGACAPLLLLDEAERASMAPELTHLGWLLTYWVLISLVSAGLTAFTRSTMWAVLLLSAWTLGISDLLRSRIPVLSGSMDQVFGDAYRGGISPSADEFFSVAAQVLIVLTAGTVTWSRRDAQQR